MSVGKYLAEENKKLKEEVKHLKEELKKVKKSSKKFDEKCPECGNSDLIKLNTPKFTMLTCSKCKYSKKLPPKNKG